MSEKTFICDSLPKEVVEEAKKELAVGGLRVDRQSPSLNKQADKLGLTTAEVASIRAKYKIDIQAIREDLAGIQLGNGYLASKELNRKLQDPEMLESLKPGELAKISKSSFDSALNLANGQTGTGNTTINIGDLKMLQNFNMERPETKVKVLDEQ